MLSLLNDKGSYIKLAVHLSAESAEMTRNVEGVMMNHNLKQRSNRKPYLTGQ